MVIRLMYLYAVSVQDIKIDSHSTRSTHKLRTECPTKCISGRFHRQRISYVACSVRWWRELDNKHRIY